MAISPGLRLQHYVIGAPLGSGGMGTSTVRRMSGWAGTVALKFLQPGRASDADQRARLLREARAASSLKSSGIA